MESIVRVLRFIALPLGYLVFVVAIAALSLAAWLLGNKHELGFFSGRLSQSVWRYPEVTRRGVQIAWLTWAILLGIAASPLDPLATRWDEAALLAIGLAAAWRRLFGVRRAGR